jgi:hypothetical protein
MRLKKRNLGLILVKKLKNLLFDLPLKNILFGMLMEAQELTPTMLYPVLPEYFNFSAFMLYDLTLYLHRFFYCHLSEL